MLVWVREKFGAVIVSGIIALIAFVFIFSGIMSPKSTRGIHEAAVAGKVNGDSVGLPEFNRALHQKQEMLRGMMGGKVTDEQMAMMQLKGATFRELAQRRLMIQEAFRLGMTASDQEVKDQIQRMPAFQKDGHFDLMQYKQILEANGYSPGGFEHTLREDLSAQRWADYFRRRAHVSDEEARRDFIVSGDRRNVKYVLLTNENGRKGIDVKTGDVQKFLADPAKLNLARSQFESKKDLLYKGKTFDAAKEDIAHQILASEKLPEIQKINEKLADQVVALLTAQKASDAKVNALLKSYGAEVKTTGFVNKQTTYFPGIGESKELATDAFAEKSPIDPAQGGKAKKYSSNGWQLIAIVTESQKPDFAKFDSQRDEVIKNLSMRKQRELYEQWMKDLVSKAKIDINPSIVNDGAEAGNADG